MELDTDHLRRRNNDLLCKDVGGQKYTKAVEWGKRGSIDGMANHSWIGYKEELKIRFSFGIT